MRHTFVVSYDICEPKRLRKMYKTMLGFGDPVQYSVFHCELNPRELVEVRDAVSRVMNAAEDRVMFIDVGPTDGRGATAIATMGRPYHHPERIAIIV